MVAVAGAAVVTADGAAAAANILKISKMVAFAAAVDLVVVAVAAAVENRSVFPVPGCHTNC